MITMANQPTVVDEFIRFLYDPSTTREDRSRLVREFNDSAKVARARVAFSFCIGDKVTFRSKRGPTRTGTIMKINRATIKVDVQGLTYICSPCILSRV